MEPWDTQMEIKKKKSGEDCGRNEEEQTVE